MSTFEQFLRLVDTTAPELTIPADYTIECDQEIIYDDASATDNCDGDVAIELETEIIEGDCPQSYQIVRTWTATDDCDNESMATQTITVQDTTAPELTIPADYTVECSDEITYDDASATDNCGMVEIGEVMTTVAGDCTGNYTMTRAFTATDECGNMTSAAQTITIEDCTHRRLQRSTKRCLQTPRRNDRMSETTAGVDGKRQLPGRFCEHRRLKTPQHRVLDRMRELHRDPHCGGPCLTIAATARTYTQVIEVVVHSVPAAPELTITYDGLHW